MLSALIILRRTLNNIYRCIIISIRYGFIVHKPLVTLRLIKNYMAIACGLTPLRTVDLAPTYACNMSCLHCFADVLKRGQGKCLEKGAYKKIADEAVALGAVHIAFQGGEPLLLADLEEYIAMLSPKRFIVSVTTNGYLLTQERIASLKKSGLDMLTVSIDSGLPQEHDKFRGVEGAFEHAIEAVRLALSNKVNVCVNTMVTNENITGEGFRKIIEMCARNHIKLTVVLPAIVGRWQERKDMLLSAENKIKLQKIMDENPFIRRDLHANYIHFGCGAVKEMIYISAYGDVMPCAYIHVLLGNVKKDSLKACREKGLSLPFFAKYLKVCPPMEDIEFIMTYLARIARSAKMPASFEEVFKK
jgi:MoaA/NifB/PqqE/SkfB family radical SAM enzyme